MRRRLAKKYIDEGYKIKEWTSRKDVHARDRYEMRERHIDKLKTVYGKNYDPHWDKGLQPQKMNDAIRMRVTTECSEQQRSDENYFKGKSGNKIKYKLCFITFIYAKILFDRRRSLLY